MTVTLSVTVRRRHGTADGIRLYGRLDGPGGKVRVCMLYWKEGLEGRAKEQMEKAGNCSVNFVGKQWTEHLGDVG